MKITDSKNCKKTAMKKFIFIIFSFLSASAFCQETVYPSAKQEGSVIIKNATVHVGNGQVLNNASVLVTNGKIAAVGTNVTAPAGATQVDAKGKHVYPGLISTISSLGLIEIGSVRATTDIQEIGDMNPNVRAIVAYNTDSKVINTLRSSGVLLSNVVPRGNFVAGQSSVVQLDAWNWEDAAYKLDGGLHVYMPSLMPAGRGFGGRGGRPQSSAEAMQQGLQKIDSLKMFFREAKAYQAEGAHTSTNLMYESVKNLFDKKQKLYVHANTVKQMLVALDFVKEFGVDLVLVGAIDSWQIADLLKQNKVSVILSQPHNLPTLPDDDVDQPYKTAAALQKAGVVFSISDDDAQTRGKNLSYNAGTAAAYGLSKEEALQAITLNAAKILGVDDKTGSIEVGKDANIVISEGDILDMRTSTVTDAYIQGRKIDLTDKHKQLNDRYQYKYKLKNF
jgi:imidazolonepropionase-like amidohydrolase